MKNLILIFLPLLIISVSACHDEPKNTQGRAARLLEKDSVALCHISKAFDTESEDYPHPWSVQDPSSWEGSIWLDTIIDPDTDEPFLTVSALTIYNISPAIHSSPWLQELKNVKEFKLYACPDAVVNPYDIPTGCPSVVIDKIDPSVPGYIKVRNDVWDTSELMRIKDWAFTKLTVHGVGITYLNCIVTYQAVLDLSGNKLTGEVANYFSECAHRANLSHNNFTKLAGGWDSWLYFSNYIPNLQYNDIPIPEEIIGTDFWKENHQWFIGNPGYVAPE